jgi:hypothetical protein
MPEEFIPLSANIFHTKGDWRARVVAALDIAITTLKTANDAAQGEDEQDFFERLEWGSLYDVKQKLYPASYDVRGDMATALDGRDTAAPKEAEQAPNPLHIGLTSKGDVVGLFTSAEKSADAGCFRTLPCIVNGFVPT